MMKAVSDLTRMEEIVEDIIHRLHIDGKYRDEAKAILEVVARDHDLHTYLPAALAVVEYCAHRDGGEAIKRRLRGDRSYINSPVLYRVDPARNFLIQILFDELIKDHRPDFLKAAAEPTYETKQPPKREEADGDTHKKAVEVEKASKDAKPQDPPADLESRLAGLMTPVRIIAALDEMSPEDKDKIIVGAIVRLNREKLAKFIMILRYCSEERRLNDVAKKLDFTIKTLYRYVNPLYKHGLLEKGSMRGYYVTVKRRFPLDKSDEEQMISLAFTMPDVFLGGIL